MVVPELHTEDTARAIQAEDSTDTAPGVGEMHGDRPSMANTDSRILPHPEAKENTVASLCNFLRTRDIAYSLQQIQERERNPRANCRGTPER